VQQYTTEVTYVTENSSTTSNSTGKRV